jgi:hypothetical protein
VSANRVGGSLGVVGGVVDVHVGGSCFDVVCGSMISSGAWFLLWRWKDDRQGRSTNKVSAPKVLLQCRHSCFGGLYFLAPITAGNFELDGCVDDVASDTTSNNDDASVRQQGPSIL